MPRQNHSSRPRHSYKSHPETEPVEPPPAKPFPILYIGLIGGALVLISLSITASFLMTGPVKPATAKGGNQPRTDLAPPPTPASEISAPADSSAPSRSATDTQPFLLRPGNLDSPDTAGSESATKGMGLSAEDLQRKDDLAEMEFRAKNYVEAERIYREILPATSSQPLAAYHIYTCLLLEDRKDDAETFLSQAGLTNDSPAPYYCKATLALVSGDTATAQSALEEARRLFPDLCAAYDPTLKALGYLP